MEKINITDIEKLVIQLHSVVKDKDRSASDRSFSSSLLSHYMSYKTLSYRQINAAKIMLSRRKSKPQRKSRSYYLYAITDGVDIKIGYSSNVGKRLKALQVSSSSELKKVWSIKCGMTIQEAKSNEKKLHRACSKYKIRGEWFSSGCMTIVKAFKPKQFKTSKKPQNTSL